METSTTRRSFVGMGMMGAAGLMGLAGLADEAKAAFEEAAPNVAPDTSDLEMLRPDISFNRLTQIRRAAIDACEDYVCADGTVIPAIWVKVREVVDGLGYGTGACNYTGDESFNGWMRLCNNDEALAEMYVKCPIGERFTAVEAAAATGRSEEEAAQMLAELAYNGMLMHIEIAGVDFYQHQRLAHGITESSMNRYEDEGHIVDYIMGMNGADVIPFPSYYPVPVNAEVVSDSKILPYDDVEALLNRHEVFCVSPCQCRYLNNALAGYPEALPPIHDFDAIKEYVGADGHLEKCVTFGEEAAFYIELGIGRAITRDEARAILQRSVEEGCVLESNYTKYTEVICSCHGSTCGTLSTYKATIEPGSQKDANMSHYNLVYDKDLCLKCGACVARCPMQAVVLDADGFPSVEALCVRCGQCCYICPAEARKLVAKPQEQIPHLPADMLEWMNVDAAYRYEKGMWPRFDV